MDSPYSNRFFKALGVNTPNTSNIKAISQKIEVDSKILLYYNKNNILPTNDDLAKIEKHLNVSKAELMIKMGILDNGLRLQLALKAKEIAKSLSTEKKEKQEKLKPIFQTKQGQLYKGDCIKLLKSIPTGSVDLIFADPPFNLNKVYPSGMNDNLADFEYIDWCEQWLEECVRVLKFGGSLFVWNIPEWSTYIAEFLNHRLKFRDLISADIKFSLPIQGKLYPSNYSLLYYCKGEKPTTFHPDRLPMEVCKKCYGDLKDYGGYKDKMNPKGINLSDVWYDIPPVRHSKYKKRKGSNELSIKLLDRIIEMASNENDVVLDPFGGSGTTYVVAELKKRKWIGMELDSCNIIIDRFKDLKEERGFLENYRENYNILFPPKVAKKRELLGLWTTDTFIKVT